MHVKLGIFPKLIGANLGTSQKLTHGNLKLQILIQRLLGTTIFIDDGKFDSIVILEIIFGTMKLIGGIGGIGEILIILGILPSTLIILGRLPSILIMLGIFGIFVSILITLGIVGVTIITEGIEIGPNSIKDGIAPIGPKLIKLGIGGSIVIIDGILILGNPMSKIGNTIGGRLIIV
jgi:hypothetical protein